MMSLTAVVMSFGPCFLNTIACQLHFLIHFFSFFWEKPLKSHFSAKGFNKQGPEDRALSKIYLAKMTTGHYSKTQEFYKCKCFSIFHLAFGPLKQFRFIIRGVARNCYLSIIKPWSLIFKFNFQAQLSRSLFAKIVAHNFFIYHALAFC